MPSASFAITLALQCLLLTAACSSETPSHDIPTEVVETEPDAGQVRPAVAGRAAGERPDAAAIGCPEAEPKIGTSCSGELRCPLQRHQDCNQPACPAGCKYLGLKPGAAVTSGVPYFAVCKDGVWTQTSEGSCSVNQSAALCECAGQDAGAF